MYVDPRVAHGRARHYLGSVRSMFNENRLPELHETILTGLRGIRRPLGRREMSDTLRNG